MSLEYFEGPAGCGKTHQMMEALQSHLGGHPLATGEMVLGITYMHGSRRRMHSRLANIPGPQGGIFSLQQSTASLDPSSGGGEHWFEPLLPTVDVETVTDFDLICQLAAALLSKEVVASWFCSRFPVVLADELQDCKRDRLGIVRAVEPKCHVNAAADEFQDLRPVGPNAAVAWLHASSGTRTVLTGEPTHEGAGIAQSCERIAGFA